MVDLPCADTSVIHRQAYEVPIEVAALNQSHMEEFSWFHAVVE